MVSMLLDAGADLEHRDTVNSIQFSKAAMDRIKSVKVAGILQKASLTKRVADSKPRGVTQRAKRSSSEPRLKKTADKEGAFHSQSIKAGMKAHIEGNLRSQNAGQISVERTKQLVAEAVSGAEGDMFKEAQQMLTAASKDAYYSLRQKVLAFTEYKCAKSGLKINARKSSSPAISIKLPNRPRAPRQPSPGLKSTTGSFAQEDAKGEESELQSALYRYSEGMTDSLTKNLVDSQVAFIRQQVVVRFKRSVEIVKAEIQEMVTEVGSIMQSRLEKEIEARILEVVNDNQAIREKRKVAFDHSQMTKTMQAMSQKEKNLLSLDLAKLKQVAFEESDLKPEDLEESIGKQSVKVKLLTKSLQHKYSKIREWRESRGDQRLASG
jgi:hypothetical protein